MQCLPDWLFSWGGARSLLLGAVDKTLPWPLGHLISQHSRLRHRQTFRTANCARSAWRHFIAEITEAEQDPEVMNMGITTGGTTSAFQMVDGDPRLYGTLPVAFQFAYLYVSLLAAAVYLFVQRP